MPQEIKKEWITFPNKKKALAVWPPPDEKAENIVAALNLPAHKSVIVIIGGADTLDDGIKPRLSQLFSRGLARAAVSAGAVVIDGGTNAGVMALAGHGVADRGSKSPLIGVAPRALVAYPGSPEADTQLDPNHSHFVLVDGDSWGSELTTIYELARVLTKESPGLVFLAGGGSITRDEALAAVRQNLRLIVVEGSGDLADQIATAWKAKPAIPEEPIIAEIVEEGLVELVSVNSSPTGLQRTISRVLGGETVLLQAWEQFAEYNVNADLQQKKFGAMQFAILAVGLLGTFLAILTEVARPLPQRFSEPNNGWFWVFYILIVIPIVLTILITGFNKFKPGNKWFLLRASAEAIKREIYSYRTRSNYYRPEAGKPTPEQQLAKKVEDITRRVMRTEVNTSALVPYDKGKGFPPYMYAAKGGDDGFSYLSPDRYVQVRLGDQLNYFRNKTVKLETQLSRLQWLIFVVGGLGTFLAAIGRQVWIALTTALVTALTTYLGYRQTENTLMKYNQAKTDLENVKSWWTALSADEQENTDNIDSLVSHTEQVLETELGGWVQQMQNALAELRKEQTPATESRETKAASLTSGPSQTKKTPAKADSDEVTPTKITPTDESLADSDGSQVSSKTKEPAASRAATKDID